jgi:hypothetical protein
MGWIGIGYRRLLFVLLPLAEWEALARVTFAALS